MARLPLTILASILCLLLSACGDAAKPEAQASATPAASTEAKAQTAPA